MTTMVIITRKHVNNKLFTYSWTTSVTPAKIPNRIKTEDDAMAYAMYLSRHGQQDEAEHFLDHYCS